MERLSRVQLYQNMINKYASEQLLFALRVNISVLRGVEEIFLTTDVENAIKEFDYAELLHQIWSNLQRLDDDVMNSSWNKALKVLKVKMMKLLSEYEKKDGISRGNGRNLFNQLINELGNFNSKIITKEEFDKVEKVRGDRPQVFLSHAYVDKAYTWALFDYFYEQNIYLYVDWMHTNELEDGKDLKSGLRERLNQSSQLLFLRTLNSELDIQGKQYIKPWCSWELGSFYNGTNPDEKYLLNLYSVDGYKNVQFHGLKLYTGVSRQRLEGIEIEP